MMKMTAVMPSTTKASSRIANAGVETGAKILGVVVDIPIAITPRPGGANEAWIVHPPT